MVNDTQLRDIYTSTRIIAVVGLSSDPHRPSFGVAKYLKDVGYMVIPINPKYTSVLGEVCYPDLLKGAQAISPQKIEIVDIFRRPEFVLPHIEEAIKIGAKVIWMQEGVEHLAGAKKAEAQGITVIMNRCIMKEHGKLMLH